MRAMEDAGYLGNRDSAPEVFVEGDPLARRRWLFNNVQLKTEVEPGDALSLQEALAPDDNKQNQQVNLHLRNGAH